MEFLFLDPLFSYLDTLKFNNSMLVSNFILLKLKRFGAVAQFYFPQICSDYDKARLLKTLNSQLQIRYSQRNKTLNCFLNYAILLKGKHALR